MTAEILGLSTGGHLAPPEQGFPPPPEIVMIFTLTFATKFHGYEEPP